MNKVRAIYKPRKPLVEGEAKPPQKQARPAGQPTPFWARLGIILLCLILKYLDLIFVGLVLWALLEDGCA